LSGRLCWCSDRCPTCDQRSRSQLDFKTRDHSSSIENRLVLAFWIGDYDKSQVRELAKLSSLSTKFIRRSLEIPMTYKPSNPASDHSCNNGFSESDQNVATHLSSLMACARRFPQPGMIPLADQPFNFTLSSTSTGRRIASTPEERISANVIFCGRLMAGGMPHDTPIEPGGSGMPSFLARSASWPISPLAFQNPVQPNRPAPYRRMVLRSEQHG
jgi:hypothetical protein